MPGSCLCFLNSTTSGCCYVATVVPFSCGNLKCGHLTLEWLYIVNVRKSLFCLSLVYLFLVCSIFSMAVYIFGFITSPKPLLLGWTLQSWLNSVELYHLYQLVELYYLRWTIQFLASSDRLFTMLLVCRITSVMILPENDRFQNNFGRYIYS